MMSQQYVSNKLRSFRLLAQNVEGFHPTFSNLNVLESLSVIEILTLKERSFVRYGSGSL